MKKILIIGIFSIVIMTNSCTRNCPDDEKIGALELTEFSKSFFPYEGNQELIFISNLGDELLFKSNDGGVHMENNPVSVYKICSEFRYNGQSTYKYFDSESLHAVYFSENPAYSFNIGLYTNTLRPEYELFYDKLLVDVLRESSIGREEIITDIRFTEMYDEGEFNIDSPMILIDEITLNGVTYSNVYKSEMFDETQIFYTKEQGLVGFTTHDSKTYNLDRIE